MTHPDTNPIAVIEQLVGALTRLKIEVVLSDIPHDYVESHFRKHLDVAATALTAGRQALEKAQGDGCKSCRDPEGERYYQESTGLYRCPHCGNGVVVGKTHPQASEPAPSTFNSGDFEGTETVAAPSTLGMKIIVDESLPADELRIVQNGNTVGTITNIAAPSTAGEQATGCANCMGGKVDAGGTAHDCAYPDCMDFDARGKLAASLTFWHRLSGSEATELVSVFVQSTALPVDAQERETKHVVSQIQSKTTDKAALPVGELTEDDKRKLVGAWFAEGWAMKAAYGMLQDYETIAAARSQPVRDPLPDMNKRILFECVGLRGGSEQDYWMLGFEASERAHGITKKGQE